jgi:acyl carrier protein
MNMDKGTVFTRTSEILSDYLRLAPGEVKGESHVVTDLGADSLALVELAFKFMEAFSIPMIAPAEELLVVDNLVDHILSLQQL